MRLSTSLLTDRMPRRRPRPQVRERSVTEEIAAVPDMPWPATGHPYPPSDPGTAVGQWLPPRDAEEILSRPRPLPVFTPAVPPAATGPMPVLREQRSPGFPGTRQDAPPADVLRRVYDGLRRHGRAQAFIADKRSLPCFNEQTRISGWQGLHTSRGPGYQRWTTDRWLDQALAAIDASVETARAEARSALDAAAERCRRNLGGAR